MKLENRIGMYYTTLAQSEREVYEAFLKQPEVAEQSSMQEAAKIYGVSIGALQRFIKKLDYRGFAEFRLAVQDYVSDMAGVSNATQQTMLSQIMQSYAQGLAVLGQQDLEDDLHDLVADLARYRVVKTVGIGNTGLSAQQLMYSMYGSGKFIDAVDDRIKVDYLAETLTDDFLIIVFSITGSDFSYEKLLTQAQEAGARTWLITMNQESGLVDLASRSIVLPSTPLAGFNQSFYRIDNRTLLYSFTEVINYYYAEYQHRKEIE